MVVRILGLAAALLAAGCSSPAETATNGPDQAGSGRTRVAALSSDPLKQEFGDVLAIDGWLLACDNLRVCRAQPRGSSGSLMIRRDPGPNGQVLVVLDGQEPGDPIRPNIASIRLEGVASSQAAPWRFDAEADRATLEGEAALDFVRTLPRASALSYDTVEGRLEVPLTRVRAVLEAMDAAQGHAGSEAAFVSVGSRPRAQLPPAPALPVVELPQAASLPPLPAGFAAQVRRANSGMFAECDDDAPSPQDESHPLDAADAIVLAECSRGLTHISYLLLRVPRAAPERAERVILPTIPEMDDAYGDGSGSYVDIEWSPDTRTLHSNYRSCAGACGDNVAWVHDGREFRLLSYAFYEAGGAESLDLYRAEVRPRR